MQNALVVTILVTAALLTHAGAAKNTFSLPEKYKIMLLTWQN